MTNEERIAIPENEYSCETLIPKREFGEVCQELTGSDNVEISVNEATITFKREEDPIRTVITFGKIQYNSLNVMTLSRRSIEQESCCSLQGATQRIVQRQLLLQARQSYEIGELARSLARRRDSTLLLCSQP